ncbi:MAG: acetyl-CoA carboxylase biotin carboxyl carrier protein [Rhodopirellula sp.]|jgi:acetyl-CoA carboxylase biotin carboxyl carrier protein|nr:acetyl-CoA carboxylase biotin carboxyl carrier protein [Rhodopirellula sp.]
MADDTPDANESFNLDKLKELIELMEKHDLTDVHLRHGAEQWRLRRGPQFVATAPAAQMAYAAPAPAAPAPVAGAPAAADPAPAAAPASNLLEIKSPIVGTYYASPTPEDSVFVTAGSKVTQDTVVCIVEAMKVFNQITADVSGTIEEILVGNGDPVESGQVLFRVKPN